MNFLDRLRSIHKQWKQTGQLSKAETRIREHFKRFTYIKRIFIEWNGSELRVIFFHNKYTYNDGYIDVVKITEEILENKNIIEHEFPRLDFNWQMEESTVA